MSFTNKKFFFTLIKKIHLQVSIHHIFFKIPRIQKISKKIHFHTYEILLSITIEDNTSNI